VLGGVDEVGVVAVVTVVVEDATARVAGGVVDSGGTGDPLPDPDSQALTRRPSTTMAKNVRRITSPRPLNPS
jgi:hypothetical protein